MDDIAFYIFLLLCTFAAGVMFLASGLRGVFLTPEDYKSCTYRLLLTICGLGFLLGSAYHLGRLIF